MTPRSTRKLEASSSRTPHETASTLSRRTPAHHRLPQWVDAVEKVFWGIYENFLKLLMRSMRGDVRDHIASQKNDHGLSYRHYKASQRRSSPKITICEIFGVVRFSTFSTASANSGSPLVSRTPGGLRATKGHSGSSLRRIAQCRTQLALYLNLGGPGCLVKRNPA
jgi:hypothetical protein